MDITKRKITKIAREVNKFTVRTLRAEGIGASEFDVIHAVRKNPGITQAEICRITGLDKGAVARKTARLEEKGYLIREDNPVDGRSKLLYATEKGEAIRSSKAHVEEVFYEWLVEPLSGEEREELARLLEILVRRCREERDAEFPHVSRLLASAQEPVQTDGKPGI